MEKRKRGDDSTDCRVLRLSCQHRMQLIEGRREKCSNQIAPHGVSTCQFLLAKSAHIGLHHMASMHSSLGGSGRVCVICALGTAAWVMSLLAESEGGFDVVG